jgi:O-antigen/teichoic acid export membrane protein
MKEKIFGYIKHISAYFSASLIPMLLMLVINPLIALNMSPEDYAITGYYSSFNNLISPLIIFYMIHYYNKRYFELNQEGRQQLKALLFKAVSVFSFIVAVVCFIVLYAYIKVFNTTIQFAILPYLAFTVFALPLMGLFNLELADFRMGRDSKSFLKLSVFNGVILVLLNLLFVVIAKWGATGKLLAPLVANVVVFSYLFIKNHKLLKVQSSWKQFGEILKFCWPLTIGAMLGYFSSGFDKTYLESLGNVTEYGFYIVGSSIAGYLYTFSTSISSTFQPDIYEAVAKNDNKLLARTIAIQIVLVSLVVALFIILCPLVIRILTAGRYIHSTTYARIISVSTVTSAVYYIVNNYTIAKGYPRLYLYTTVLSSLMIVLLMPVAINKYEYIGGAWMVSGSYVILTGINLFLLYICQKARASNLKV